MLGHVSFSTIEYVQEELPIMRSLGKKLEAC